MADSVSRMAANRQAIQPVAFPAFDKTMNAAVDRVLEKWREQASVSTLKAINALAKAPDFPLRRNVSGFSTAAYAANGYAVIPHRLATTALVGQVFKTVDQSGVALTIQPSVDFTLATVDVDNARIILKVAPAGSEEFRAVLIG